jgi:hypothetical protein
VRDGGTAVAEDASVRGGAAEGDSGSRESDDERLGDASPGDSEQHLRVPFDMCPVARDVVLRTTYMANYYLLPPFGIKNRHGHK